MSQPPPIAPAEVEEWRQAPTRPCVIHGTVKRFPEPWFGITSGCAPACGTHWICPLCRADEAAAWELRK